jgi:hypothetical protein
VVNRCVGFRRIRRSLDIAILPLVAVGFGLAICACGNSAAPHQATAAPSRQTSRSSPVTNSLPPSSTPCGSIGPTTAPASSSRLAPLLMTSSDVPLGYVTEGQPTLSATSEFFAAVPESLPQVSDSFSMNSDPGPGGVDLTQMAIVEALTKTSSAQSAILLLQKVEAAQTACGGGTGTSIALPGDVPNLIATESIGSTSSQSIATAVVLVQRGPYVVEVRWFNSNLADPTLARLPSSARLPSPQAMESVVNAALGHLPT